MNPSSIETVNVNIDSRYRVEPRSTSSTEFIINIPTAFQNVISARVTSIEIPNISHVFGSKHTTVLQVRPGPDLSNPWSALTRKSWETIILPPANYTRDTIEAIIRDEIGKKLGFTQTATPVSARGFTTNIDDYTGRVDLGINFTSTEYPTNTINPDLSSFDINFTPVDLNSIYSQAYTEGVFTTVPAGSYYLKEIELYAEALRIYSSTIPSGTPVLRDLLGFSDFMLYGLSGYLSTGFFNLYEPRYYFLQVNDYDTIQHVLANNVVTAFAKVPIKKRNVRPDIHQEDDIVSKDIVFEQPVDIPSFRVRLIDPVGNLVNLLGQDFSFTVELKYIRDTKKYDYYRDDYIKSGEMTSPSAPPTRLRNIRIE
jgi:hypothetical protein